MSITLPAASEAMRCSDFTRLHRVDPAGTGLAPDVLVLVEVPEPWPKPAGKHGQLVELVRIAAEHDENVRLLAAVPHDPMRPRVVAFRPIEGGASRTELELGDAPAEALRRALTGPATDHVLVAEMHRSTVLVCTQGSHDICCGTDGAELAEHLDQHPDLEVFRVSHTGGHRFAPTAMTLPDGRMWAYLDEATVRGIVDRTLDPIDAAEFCRGWWGLPQGPPQVAERMAFAAVGWEFDERARHAVVEPDDGGGATVELSAGSDRWRIEVRPGREVVTIKCEAPGGLPTKPGREWELGEVSVLGPSAPRAGPG